MEAGADFEAQTSTGERAMHIAILRMDIRILAAILDVGADKTAPCLQVWQGNVMQTPKEMCTNLQPPYGEQIAGILNMTVKQRAVVIGYMDGNAGGVRRGEISAKIHVINGVKEKRVKGQESQMED